MQDSASFWTDIKNLEEQLAKSPASFCFARLSEVYLKVGLVDDALFVARQGVVRHPRYLSGQRALAMASHAKGFNDEAMVALHLVTEALPEDVPSQKLLGRLLVDSGKQDAALYAFRTALEFAPDDMECRIELESIERLTCEPETVIEDDEEILDDLEILDELEIFEEDQVESEGQGESASIDLSAPVATHSDPLSTGTLAELYVSQGFIHKALEIYRAILADNPMDLVTSQRIAELNELEAGSTAVNTEVYGSDDVDFDEVDDTESVNEYVFSNQAENFTPEAETFVPTQQPEVMFVPEIKPVAESASMFDNGTYDLPQQGVADNALSTLDGWLENIRRIKSCR